MLLPRVTPSLVMTVFVVEPLRLSLRRVARAVYAVVYRLALWI